MKNLLYIFIILSLSNCNNRKELIPGNIIKVEEKNSYIHKNDTNTSEKHQQKKSNINDTNKDSIFFVKGLSLEVNGISCYWEYKVKRIGIKKNDALNIIILYQKLKTLPNDRTLFETANEVENSNYFNLYHSLDGIVKSKAYNLECEDINDDSYCDFTIVIERAAAGANVTSEAYLFNPKNKKFEHSEIFSGTNIEYDKEKNRIFTMWKMGGGKYAFRYRNLNRDKKEIDFFEEIYQNRDSIIYTKSIGKKILKRKTIILKEWPNEVHVEDSQYLLERNKK